ncbi:hypothetical protein MUN76_15205 [Leucobacter rhizosphaerae]|uniref:Uncharacterized protein n=1 Tax=Leucobacter rhizosphaerae TaxID=2932245 RepID=A0ABY4FVM6_9MICO|nr:hypothetical protein [Leucobacter rhizosphaerae]UOQ60356.1 hypothetical protein MUN76_15205 [Leucobacter rhizosphaerae]
MDIATTTEPKSDQQNFDDYQSAPKTVTVSEVKKGSAEQPVEIHLVEFPGRPFKPSKSMRRVLVAAWGGEASNYPGRILRLYGDPTVKFGGQTVGGIRISHMSHLTEPVTVHLTVTRGKRAPFTVQPIATPQDATAWLTEATTLEELQKAWGMVQRAGLGAIAELANLKDSRKAELQ